jgi:hypothetical protein
MPIPPEVIAAAQAAQRKWRVWASVSLAQYGIESAWGRFEPPGSNNGFGVQALPGLPAVAAASHEFRNGRMLPVVEHFAVFASVADAFDKHAELIASNRVYRGAMAAPTAEAFALALTGVYATAPHYGDALVSMMREMQLEQYDMPMPPAPPVVTVADMQAMLNAAGAKPPLDVDGIFGAATRAAVLAFQEAHSLALDGDPGPETLGALAKAVAS